MRYNPFEMFSKETDRRRHQYQSSRDNFPRYPLGIPDLLPTSTVKHHMFNDEILTKRNQSDPHEIYNVDESRTPSREGTPSTSKDILDEILLKRGASYLKEGIRFNPFAMGKEKSTSIPTSTSSSTSPSAKSIAESVLMHDSSMSNEDDTKCTLCNASFPSLWLLEQHQALQHSSGSSEEKNYLSDS